MANASMPKKLKNFRTSDDSDGFASWIDLNHDLLILIMMRVGVFDFIALSGVCKQWRSVAVSNWNKFMVTQQPMRLSISKRLLRKDCYLEDHNKRRKLKTIIPHSNGRKCVGITYGYLIFYGRKTCDFWLVNPITRKQLHFPGFPFAKRTHTPEGFRGILVYSPSLFGWVFVVLYKYSTKISFSLAGKKGRWRKVTSDHQINDLHFFKGKIFMINTCNQLYELRLNSEPTLILLKMENFPWSPTRSLTFVSSGEHLYVKDVFAQVFEAVEADFDEMKWVNSERTLREYAVFITDFYKSDVAIKPDTWAHPSTQYKQFNYFRHKKINNCLTSSMWYFPHECLNDKNPDMKNGGLLNILNE